MYSPRGRPNHSSFYIRNQPCGDIPTGPHNGASNADGAGRNRDSETISGFTASTVPAASAIHLAMTDHGKFITLLARKWRSLLMVGNKDEVYDKKP